MNPMRFNESCPDCGYVIPEALTPRQETGFDCPRCGAHYALEDFLVELHEKHQAQHHNHAKADLTGEENS